MLLTSRLLINKRRGKPQPQNVGEKTGNRAGTGSNFVVCSFTIHIHILLLHSQFKVHSSHRQRQQQFNSIRAWMVHGFQFNVRLRLLVRVAEHLPVVGQPPSVVVHLLVLLGQQQQQVLVLLLQQTQLPV